MNTPDLGSVAAPRGGAWSVAQATALVFGIWWTINGLGALLINPNFSTGHVHGGGTLLGLVTITANGWHGVFHLLTGIAGIVVARHPHASLVYTLSAGALYIAVGALGLIVGGSALGVIAVDSSGDIVHIAEGVLVCGAGLLTR